MPHSKATLAAREMHQKKAQKSLLMRKAAKESGATKERKKRRFRPGTKARQEGRRLRRGAAACQSLLPYNTVRKIFLEGVRDSGLEQAKLAKGTINNVRSFMSDWFINQMCANLAISHVGRSKSTRRLTVEAGELDVQMMLMRRNFNQTMNDMYDTLVKPVGAHLYRSVYKH